jgi:hypothetical protein
MKRSKLVILAMSLLLMVMICWGQYSLPDFPQSSASMKYARGTYVPSTMTYLAGTTVMVSYIRFSNTSSSVAAVITVQDQSTDCGGGACQVFPAATLAANSFWVVPLDSAGEVFKGGIGWSATGSTVVYGYIRMRY